MATWVPINGLAIQLAKNAGGAAAADYYLKFYDEGTTTPASMATDSTGGTTLDKCKLDANGLAVNGSDDPFIPHIDRNYKIACYTNATDADNNTTGSAFFVIDNLKLSSAINSLYTPEGTNPTTVSIATYLDKRVLTDVTALRAYEPVVDEEQVNLLGHTTEGIGGGAFYYDETDSATADDNGTVIVTSGGARWKRQLDGFVTPEMFGWVSGDIQQYLTDWIASSYEEMRITSDCDISAVVTADMSTVTTAQKRLTILNDAVITHTDATAGLRVTASTKDSLLPFFYLIGGRQALFDDTSVGVNIRDVRNFRAYAHFPYGDITKATSRGTGWKLENVDAYTERTMLIDCGAPYCKHDILFHTAGGEDGGLSFARTVISNFSLNGGVSGQAKIALTTDIEATINVGAGNANNYTIGETVNQAVSGATAVVLGWPEARDIVYLKTVVGTFDTSNAVVGVTSGASYVPSSITIDRLPNIYDSTIEGIRGNITTGAIVMELGGGMIGTRLRDFQVEASGTSYYFRDKNAWTFERPVIDFPSVANNMTLFEPGRTAHSSRPAFGGEGVEMPVMDVIPRSVEGILAAADGTNWNPQGVGTGDGGKGIFAYLRSGWRRLGEVVSTTDANYGDSGNSVNTSGKYQGKIGFDTTLETLRVAQSAAAGDIWFTMMRQFNTNTTELSDISHTINTSGKYANKVVVAGGVIYVAQGALSSSAWRPAHTNGSANDITPS